uniref:hypothetical protein n=1 Tax=uncultured Sphingomonas sp. TaxID=158754 RepID=UPI0035CA461D
MAQPVPIHLALERITSDLHSLTFDVEEASRSIGHAERKMAEGERIAAALHDAGDRVRRLFRG